jgi:FimV-like protein
MLDRGHTDGVKKITQELRRDWRGSKQGEFAALVMESLCAEKEGEPAKAKQALEKALVLQAEGKQKGISQKLSVDLARACLATGDDATAQDILRKVAAENHEDRSMIAHIQGVFAKTGNEGNCRAEQPGCAGGAQRRPRSIGANADRSGG